MPETLKPLEKHRKDFTTFSNLDHGFTGGHQGVPVLLSGVRPILAHNYDEGNISLDQKLAEYHGAAALSFNDLGVREKNLLSFTRTGVQVPTINMQQAYRAMFFEDTNEKKISQAERFKRQNSILDVVMGQAKSLNKELGKQDQEKLEEYLGSVRSLEKKISQQEPWLNKPKPKTDVPEPKPGNGTAEQLKAMIEIIALAIQTDSTRSITCSSGFANGDFGLNGGYHGFSHHGERDEPVAALKKIEGYQISMMSYLIDLLKLKRTLLMVAHYLIIPLYFMGAVWRLEHIRPKTCHLYWLVEASNTENTKCTPCQIQKEYPQLIYYYQFCSKVDSK